MEERRRLLRFLLLVPPEDVIDESAAPEKFPNSSPGGRVANFPRDGLVTGLLPLEVNEMALSLSNAVRPLILFDLP